MPIATGEFDDGKEVFYTERFKTLVRSQREVLLKYSTLVPLLEDTIKYAYKNDFYTLLRHYKIPAHMRWTTAFLNDITNPFQNILEMKEFLRLDESVLYELMARSNTTKA